MQLSPYQSFPLLLLAAAPVKAIQPYQFNVYDLSYEAALRDKLPTFHESLTSGVIPAENNANDTQWNFDGQLYISREAWRQALTAVAGPGGLFKNVGAIDTYRLIDGNVAGTLYKLQGEQNAEFAGIPAEPGNHFNVWGSELFLFNENVETTELFTVEQIGRLATQLAGEAPVPPPRPLDGKPVRNKQTSPEYRDARRAAMASMHQNVLAGRPQANAQLAVKDVVVDEGGIVRHGRKAFMEAVAATNQGSGAFPVKQIHDEYILSDGHLGQIEYAWQGAQLGEYADRAPVGKTIRMRGMLFFEFDPQGQVEKMVTVYDERVVLEQLESNATYYLYP